MLLNLREYHRTADSGGLERALDLLARPDTHTVPLAGGDTLVGSGDPAVEAVVDLQGLGLDTISLSDDGTAYRIGAMVTRARLAGWLESRDAESRPLSPMQELLALAAHRSGGSIQRNRATLGGAIVVSASNDPLVAALLVCDAEVTLATRSGLRTLPLVAFLAQRSVLVAAPAIITELAVPIPPGGAGYAMQSVARTPSDAPIVLAAAAVVSYADRIQSVRLALGGVDRVPVLLSDVETMLSRQPLSNELIAEAVSRALQGINPPGDFRGSSEYRREVAGVLARRALSEAWRRAT